MSNALAIATVTQALALLIENNLRPEIDMAVSVETRKPPAEPPTDPTITVFLYQVTPNPSMRNIDLPARGPHGQLWSRPTVALDLNYLISAYGEETELVGQRLIGCVVRTLQEIPVLPTELIQQAAERPYLSGSDLAESAQKVRFSPIQMDIDETSKLWGMLHQTPYSVSVTYQGSLVFIDGREEPEPATSVEEVNPTAETISPNRSKPKRPDVPASDDTTAPADLPASPQPPEDSANSGRAEDNAKDAAPKQTEPTATKQTATKRTSTTRRTSPRASTRSSGTKGGERGGSA